MSDNDLISALEFGGSCQVPVDALAPDFAAVAPLEKVHNWRNYIPVTLRPRWDDLSHETRIAMAFMAQEQAEAEEWD